MRARILAHVRANVVAYLALFVMLGGATSYAATELGRNDVRSKQIKDGQVKNRDLGRNAVTSPKVANGSLLEDDFAAGQLPSGPPGPPGADGAPGQDATSLFAYIRDPGSVNAATVAYGSGVADVTDVSGNTGEYTVTFNRSLVNCIVQVTSGVGDPQGSGSGNQSFPFVNLSNGGPNTTQVIMFNSVSTGTDTSFLISAFC